MREQVVVTQPAWTDLRPRCEDCPHRHRLAIHHSRPRRASDFGLPVLELQPARLEGLVPSGAQFDLGVVAAGVGQ